MPFSQSETDRIRTTLHTALASTRLSSWQRNFLTDMQVRFDQYGPRTRLSDKQHAKLKQTLAPFETQRPTNRPQAVRPTSRPAKLRSPLRPPSPFRVVRKARRSIRGSLWLVMAVGGLLALLAGMFEPNGPNPERMISSPRASDPVIYTSAGDFSVTDGDTVQIRGARKGTRLVGLNTPETYRPECDRELALGQQATSRLKDLVRTADQVELRLVACACPPGTQGTDDCNFGRSCGVLRVDGRDVSDILIGDGLAVRFQCGQTSCPRLPRPWCG